MRVCVFVCLSARLLACVLDECCVVLRCCVLFVCFVWLFGCLPVRLTACECDRLCACLWFVVFVLLRFVCLCVLRDCVFVCLVCSGSCYPFVRLFACLVSLCVCLFA